MKIPIEYFEYFSDSLLQNYFIYRILLNKLSINTNCLRNCRIITLWVGFKANFEGMDCSEGIRYICKVNESCKLPSFLWYHSPYRHVDILKNITVEDFWLPLAANRAAKSTGPASTQRILVQFADNALLFAMQTDTLSWPPQERWDFGKKHIGDRAEMTDGDRSKIEKASLEYTTTLTQNSLESFNNRYIFTRETTL